MRLMTWNMGHGSPGAKRVPNDEQWAAVAAMQPDVVLAQETRDVEVDGYRTLFTRYPRTGWGAAVAVREGYGSLERDADADRPGLLACGVVERASGPKVFVASVHVPAEESAQGWLRRLAAMEMAQAPSVLIGGDFNAGPSIGRSPTLIANEVELLELTSSDPEHNTLVRPQHPGTTFQIDHVLGRGWARQGPMCVLPFADVGGPQLSDHNALWLSLVED